MVRQPAIRAFYFLVLFLLANCGLQQERGNANLEGGDPSGDAGKYSGNFSSGGDMDPKSGYGELKDALAQVPTENKAQQDAVSSAQQLVGGIMTAYDGLDVGDSVTELQRFIQSMDRARIQALVVAQLLQDAGFNELAELFRKLAVKIDVMRLYNPATGRHMYWGASAESFIFAMATGQRYEGIAFRVYKTQQLDVNCRTPLNSCLVQSDNFLSNNEACEGQRKIVRLGYVCAAPAPMNPLPLARFLRTTRLQHLSTMNPLEIKKLKANTTWKFEGYQGFPTF